MSDRRLAIVAALLAVVVVAVALLVRGGFLTSVYFASIVTFVLGWMVKGPSDPHMPPMAPPSPPDAGGSSSAPAIPDPPVTVPQTPSAKRLSMMRAAYVGGVVVAAAACGGASQMDPLAYSQAQIDCIEQNATRAEIDACRAAVRERAGLPPRDAGAADGARSDAAAALAFWPVSGAGAPISSDAGDAASSPRDGGDQ